ncbi:hypothetical protein HZS_5295 [Henneguya salminicola]|nr:hypothetical protein HZS_5295 [Henneguya salminicola]
MFAAFAFIQEYNVIQAYEAWEEHICINGFEQQFRELLNYYEDNFMARHSCIASLQRQLSLVDVKIDTIHIRTTQQNTRHYTIK